TIRQKHRAFLYFSHVKIIAFSHQIENRESIKRESGAEIIKGFPLLLQITFSYRTHKEENPFEFSSSISNFPLL
ncbi:MAG: hypothetical protein SO205_09300, partial [Bulleidia sp.]|nr:hypothetical protein [Bulleidia sp.]